MFKEASRFGVFDLEIVGKASLDEAIGEWLRLRYYWDESVERQVNEYLQRMRTGPGIDISVLLPPKPSSSVDAQYGDPGQNHLRRKLFDFAFRGFAPSLAELRKRNLWSRVVFDIKEIEHFLLLSAFMPIAFGGPRSFSELVEYNKKRYSTDMREQFVSYKETVLREGKIDGPLIAMEGLHPKSRPILLEPDGLTLLFVFMREAEENGDNLQVKIPPFYFGQPTGNLERHRYQNWALT